MQVGGSAATPTPPSGQRPPRALRPSGNEESMAEASECGSGIVGVGGGEGGWESECASGSRRLLVPVQCFS